jgi:CheY-like chemotaxis protein
VRIDVAIDGAQVIVRVCDHGDGIDPALQPRIFDLFIQGEQQLDRPRGGLGVGLSLAKTIVDLHGGSIAVHSEGEGTGAALSVALPLDDSVRVAAVARNGSSRPRRIVLVDDQEDSRSMLKVLFEARDHVVFDAADGPEGIALIETHHPDVAFIDIGLPKMNGFEVAQYIRKRRDLDNVVLVALTGYGGHADIEAASQAGFDEHVTKPAELRRLEQILEGKKSTAEHA